VCSTERDGEQKHMPIFYVQAENAREARTVARTILGEGHSVITATKVNGIMAQRQVCSNMLG